MTAIHILFWSLTVAIFVVPRSLALAFYLLTLHLDLSGPEWTSTVAVGAENAVKVVVLPTVLLLRGRISIRRLLRRLVQHTAGRFWLAFCVYVSFATMWSPFFLSAAKFLGYLYGYTIFTLVAIVYWDRGLVTRRTLLLALWGAIALAMWQTLLTDLYFGGGLERRFTSFSSPQSFAVFLATWSILLSFAPRGPPGSTSRALVLLAHAAILVSIVLSGSRSTFVGYVIAFSIRWAVHLKNVPNDFYLLQRTLKALAVTAMFVVGIILATTYLPTHRLTDLFAASFGQVAPEEIGTFAWRISMYRSAADALAGRTPARLLFGSGTSSGGKLALRHGGTETPDTLDPNRVFHNEFLRALYEWGLVGFFLFVGFLLMISVHTVRAWLAGQWKPQMLLCVLPLFFIGLTIENMFTRPGTPTGAAIALAIGFAWHSSFLRRPGHPRHRP